MPQLPFFVELLFIGSTALTFLLLFNALYKANFSGKLLLTIALGCFIWLTAISILSLNGFYIIEPTGFPKIVLSFMPTILFLVLLFVLPKARKKLDDIPLKALTWIHIVRIPVEFGLYYLFVYKAVPELMTFAGRNFDIVAGITAPIVVFLTFYRNLLSKKVLLVWNIIMLGFLLFIVVNALLAAPHIFQQFAFDQPNVAIAYFPVVWLQGFIVPVVLFSHFVAIRQLLKK